MTKSIGIDLAGKKENPTGFAVLEDERIETRILNRDEEIIEACKREGPDIIAIDAPLSLPEEGNLRKSDSELIARGHKVLPPALGGMKDLTRRGIRIARNLRESGFKVIEIHPRTSGKILTGYNSTDEWTTALKEKGWLEKSNLSEHEIDSTLAAITGLLYEKGLTEEVSREGEGIVIPSKSLPSP